MLDKALVLAAEDNLPRIAFAELTDADAPVRVKRSCKPDDVSFIERRLVFLQPYDVFMRVSWTVPDTFGHRICLVAHNHRAHAPAAATPAYARRTAPASAQPRHQRMLDVQLRRRLKPVLAPPCATEGAGGGLAKLVYRPSVWPCSARRTCWFDFLAFRALIAHVLPSEIARISLALDRLMAPFVLTPAIAAPYHRLAVVLSERPVGRGGHHAVDALGGHLTQHIEDVAVKQRYLAIRRLVVGLRQSLLLVIPLRRGVAADDHR